MECFFLLFFFPLLPALTRGFFLLPSCCCRCRCFCCCCCCMPLQFFSHLLPLLQHAHAPKAITDAAVEKAESRSLLHYCSDTPVGLSRGQYTMMLEMGDGSSSCVGTHLSSPRMCDRATDPTCKRWMEVGPDMSDYLAKEASLMLDEWKPQQDYVAKGKNIFFHLLSTF